MNGFSCSHSRRTECVGAILEGTVKKARRTESSTWEFVQSNGVSLPVTAQIRGNWLALEVPLTGSRWEALSARPWEVLRLNAEAWGPFRFLLPSRNTHALRLAADIPLVDGIPLEKRIPEALLNLQRCAHLRLNGKEKPDNAAAVSDPVDLTPVVRLCEECGRQAKVRSDVEVTVPLDPPLTHSAVICPGRNNSFRVRLSVLSWKAAPHDHLDAFGGLLLQVSDCVATVRASAVAEGDRTGIGFETALGADATSSELDLALGAISIAAGECLEEVKMLRDPGIAALFASMRSHSCVQPGKQKGSPAQALV